MPERFEYRANRLRADLKKIELEVRDMMNDERFKQEQSFANQHGEVKANVMLAVRHIEDGRMRLGKAIQYCGDGVSCYDK